jgi:hypothetical protein
VREAIVARAAGDYVRMMGTGIVCKKVRMIGSGTNAKLVEEYEIDTAAVEALNCIERRAAIETGQEVEKRNVSVNAQVSETSISLAVALGQDGLNELRQKLVAARDRIKGQLAAPEKVVAASGSEVVDK